MIKYDVTGMSCAACSARVEKAVKGVDGVTSVSVNLLTNSMGVEGTARPETIIKAVEDAGYGASLSQGELLKTNDEIRILIIRLIVSAILTAVLMILGMKELLSKTVQLILSLAVMIINGRFFVNGFKGIIHLAPNMDTLVAMGSLASFIYGYYDSAAMILTLITVGKLLESKSKGRTTDAIKELLKLSPKTANVIRDGREEKIPVEEVRTDDIFSVYPGENIPVDAIVIEGSSAIDESALTGESIPVDKTIGDKVSAATTNKSGYLRCKATRVGKDTTLAQIIQMVSDAAATKAPIARIADKVSGVFVPIVIGTAIITFIVWTIAGKELGFSLSRAISVLVISCPCALGLATPVAIMVGSGLGAKSGILFKTAASLEAAGKVAVVALDKTGTITSGVPVVTDVIPEDGVSEEELLKVAYALESRSEHPLAKAVSVYSEEKKIIPYEITDFKALTGVGVEGIIDGERAFGGREAGEPLVFRTGNKRLGIIKVADIIKEDSSKAVSELKKLGIRTVMITGDKESTARSIADHAGIDDVIAEVLPEGKTQAVKSLMKYGKVMMVGDGINDAPALTTADIGVAIGAGTDVAIDAADIVLMKSRLEDVPALIRLSRATLKNIKENLFWAFFYNVICIPLAAGVWIPIFGWELNPMIGAAAMSISSFTVVTNALRLNLFRLYDSSHDRTLRKKETGNGDTDPENKETDDKKTEKENKMFKTTIEVTGMKCPMCEKHTREALEKAFGLTDVVASHEENKVTFTSAEKIDETKLAEVIKEAGYEPGKVTVE